MEENERLKIKSNLNKNDLLKSELSNSSKCNDRSLITNKLEVLPLSSDVKFVLDNNKSILAYSTLNQSNSLLDDFLKLEKKKTELNNEIEKNDTKQISTFNSDLFLDSNFQSTISNQKSITAEYHKNFQINPVLQVNLLPSITEASLSRLNSANNICDNNYTSETKTMESPELVIVNNETQLKNRKVKQTILLLIFFFF